MSTPSPLDRLSVRRGVEKWRYKGESVALVDVKQSEHLPAIDDPLGWLAFHPLRPSDIHPVLTEGDPMSYSFSQPSLDALRRQRDTLDQRIAQAVAIATTYGDDDFEVGTVLVFDKTFRTGQRRTYSFAVIKTPVGWFPTGRNSTVGKTWTELIDFIADDALHLPVLYRVTEMEQHVPDN